MIVSAGYPQKKTMAFRLKPENGAARLAWEFTKGTAYVTSPIVYGDYIYLSTDGGILTCLDVRTGEVKYKEQQAAGAGDIHGVTGSRFGGHLYMTSEDGDTFVITARHHAQGGPAPTRSASRYSHLPRSPTARIYIRGEQHLFAIR